jgi:glycosyltransferase involved in cell wall biosynthesis
MSDSSLSRKRPRLLVLYEYGADFRPYGSSFLRLIRPLTHPEVQAHLDTRFGRNFDNQPADLVIIDRLWRSDVSLPLIQELVNKIRLKGSGVIYNLDDNYFDLPFIKDKQPVGEIPAIVSFLLRQADAVLVTTPALRKRLLEYNPNIHVLPNQLDERLLVTRYPGNVDLRQDQKRITVGYMGTFTHDEDLRMILPALKSIQLHYPGRIEFQVVGVVNKEQTKQELQELPIRYVYPRPEEHEYPLFMLWFTGSIHWDIAISPLANTPFNSCKSDIKFLDYASIGAAGIFSQSPAYLDTVHHRQNGWLAENSPEAWEKALEALINDPTLRLNIARDASRYLYTQRTLAQRGSDWVDLLKSLC